MRRKRRSAPAIAGKRPDRSARRTWQNLTFWPEIAEQQSRRLQRLGEKVKRTKLKLANKLGALVDLGRHLKLFTEKVEVEGTLKLDMQDARQKLLVKINAIQIEA